MASFMVFHYLQELVFFLGDDLGGLKGQMRVVWIDERTHKCRLMRGCTNELMVFSRVAQRQRVRVIAHN